MPVKHTVALAAGFVFGASEREQFALSVCLPPTCFLLFAERAQVPVEQSLALIIGGGAEKIF